MGLFSALPDHSGSLPWFSDHSKYGDISGGEGEVVPGGTLIAGVPEYTGLVCLVVVLGRHNESTIVQHCHPPGGLEGLSREHYNLV